MKKKQRDPLRDRKENTLYTLLFFFLGSFAIKTVFGGVTDSKSLLISGMFELFGVFLSVVTLMRIHAASQASVGLETHFGSGRLEFLVTAGISLFIALATGAFLFTIGHFIFYHSLYPPGLVAAWVAALLAAANLMMVRFSKSSHSEIEKTYERRVRFIFEKGFLLSTTVVGVVIISRSGFYALDSIFAILEAMFIVCYSVYFLSQSFKGLLDAAAKGVTPEVISGWIKKSEPQLEVQSVKVEAFGPKLEIFIFVTVPPVALAKGAKESVKKIENLLKSHLAVPHEVHVGFSGV